MATFVSCSVIDNLAQYSVPGFSIGHGTVNQGVNVPLGGTDLQDGDIQSALWSALTSNPPLLPAPNANSLYVAFLSAGVSVTGPGIGKSCTGHCGYHAAMNNQIPYVVMPWLDCGPCHPNGLAPFDAVTASTSHEICEAVTDPFTSPPSKVSWQDPNGDEIADKCSATTVPYRVDGTPYYVARIWSNGSNSCV